MVADTLRCYTPDVYVGPDITNECMDLLAGVQDEMVYIEPVQDSNRRVVVGILNSMDDIRTISKELIPLCYAIGSVVTGGKTVVKWYNTAS